MKPVGIASPSFYTHCIFLCRRTMDKLYTLYLFTFRIFLFLWYIIDQNELSRIKILNQVVTLLVIK